MRFAGERKLENEYFSPGESIPPSTFYMMHSTFNPGKSSQKAMKKRYGVSRGSPYPVRIIVLHLSLRIKL
jgi:hypothetical protein